MHTPISNLIRERIEELQWQINLEDNRDCRAWLEEWQSELARLLSKSEAIEKDSVENLLNEMPRNVVLSRMLDGTNDWHASSVDFIEDSSINWYGNTHKEALLSLKEKLNNK